MNLYIGFVILSALLLWAVIYARGPWPLKLVLIVTVPLYGVVVWHSIEQWKGYPVHVYPPARSSFTAAIVQEPERIYLWVTPPGSSGPRAYVVPYSRQLHQVVQRAGDIQKRERGGARLAVRRDSKGRFHLYRLPPVLPPKENP